MTGGEGYTGRDYGTHARQQDEYLEMCGMHEDHKDPDWQPPLGDVVLSSQALDETSRYPMDDRNTRRLRRSA